MADGGSSSDEFAASSGRSSSLDRGFDGFYTRFILRDLVGKVVPGFLFFGVIASTIAGVPATYAHLQNAHLPEMLFMVGLSWVSTLSIQAMFDAIGLFRYFPGDFRTSTKDVVRFMRIATPDEKAQYERFVVIKEGCGNNANALLLGLLFWLVLNLARIATGAKHQFRQALSVEGVFLLTLGIAVLVFLYVMHREHVRRQFDYVTMTLELHAEQRLPSNQKP